MLKLKTQQMVAFAMRDPQNLGAHVLGGLWNRRRSGKGRAGYFERNLRCWPKSAMHGHECSTRGKVQGSGKLQKILAIIVSTADEYRDGECQTRRFATFHPCLEL